MDDQSQEGRLPGITMKSRCRENLNGCPEPGRTASWINSEE